MRATDQTTRQTDTLDTYSSPAQGTEQKDGFCLFASVDDENKDTKKLVDVSCWHSG
jgi:hypothetical protein